MRSAAASMTAGAATALISGRLEVLVMHLKIEWVVNSNAELGVKVGDDYHFLYKGRSIIYKDGKHDDGSPMYVRTVGKREFGECCHPLNYKDTAKHGTVSLDDCDRWKELPASTHPDAV
jgi:hypothetical protein